MPAKVQNLNLSVWERMGKQAVPEGTVDNPLTILERATIALKLAEKALTNSVPKHPHYAEAHVAHAKALATVRAVLTGGSIPPQI